MGLEKGNITESGVSFLAVKETHTSAKPLISNFQNGELDSEKNPQVSANNHGNLKPSI